MTWKYAKEVCKKNGNGKATGGMGGGTKPPSDKIIGFLALHDSYPIVCHPEINMRCLALCTCILPPQTLSAASKECTARSTKRWFTVACT